MKKKITHEQFQQLLMIAGITYEDSIMLTKIDMMLDERIMVLSNQAAYRERDTMQTSAFISQVICERLKSQLLELIKGYIQYA